MTRLYMLCFVALAVLSACASPVQPPASVFVPLSSEVRAADMRRAELKVKEEKQGKEFEDKWTHWNEKAKELRADLEAINQESTLVANHPGWSDMAQILKSYASIRYLEGEASAARKRTVALTQWSQKWQANGGEIYEKSHLLFNRIAVIQTACHEFEKDYEKIKPLYLAWVLLVSAGRSDEGGAESAWKIGLAVGEANVFAPSIRTLSELAALLKKPIITLGFTEKEKP